MKFQIPESSHTFFGYLFMKQGVRMKCCFGSWGINRANAAYRGVGRNARAWGAEYMNSRRRSQIGFYFPRLLLAKLSIFLPSPIETAWGRSSIGSTTFISSLPLSNCFSLHFYIYLLYFMISSLLLCLEHLSFRLS